MESRPLTAPADVGVSGSYCAISAYICLRDLVFVLDVTGSMQPYINEARSEINNIATDLMAYGDYGPGDLRLGLIVFRDHPPQDRTLLAQTYGFTTDINTLRTHLAGLTATGGGDGPEAQEDALELALFSGWRPDAAKVVELITDSPPHGISPRSGDGFPSGCPMRKVIFLQVV